MLITLTRRPLVATALVAGLVITPGGAAAGPAPGPSAGAASVAPDNGRICRTSMLAVSLETSTYATPGSNMTVPLTAVAPAQEVFIKLCLPKGRPTPRAVQVLVHGVSYDHRYWNIADPANLKGDRYSWEAAAAQAGYATIAIDRIGEGQSTHPPSPAVDIDSNASVVHQVIAAARAGRIPAPGGRERFSKVVLVGHSYGSMVAFIEASRFHDVDALVLTGVSHNVHEVTTPTSIESHHYPAVLDPQFAGTTLDPGYVTSLPGARYGQYYAPGTDVDMRIVASDEATKGTFSQFEVWNYPVIFRTQLDLQAPVFYLDGSRDGIFCSQAAGDLAANCSSSQTLIANERPWLGAHVPSVDAHITPGAGHALNAFRSSQESFTAAQRWLTSKVLASHPMTLGPATK